MESIVLYGFEYNGKMEYYTNIVDLQASQNYENDEIYLYYYEINTSIIHNYLQYFNFRKKYKEEEYYMFYYNKDYGDNAWEDYLFILTNLFADNFNLENKYHLKLMKNEQIRLLYFGKIQLDENGNII